MIYADAFSPVEARHMVTFSDNQRMARVLSHKKSNLNWQSIPIFVK